jgi:8-oxo-dGTP pyrophosphatase MutT (NUDIX family)
VWQSEAELEDPYSLTVRTGVEVAVFVTRKSGSEVLIVHRSPEQGGYWHVIAGGVEPGETVEEAAQRELREETGLVAEVMAGTSVIEYVYPLTEEPAARRNQYDQSIAEVEVTCFHVTAPDDWEPKLDWEHDGHRWCAPCEAFTALRWPLPLRPFEGSWCSKRLSRISATRLAALPAEGRFSIDAMRTEVVRSLRIAQT